MIKCDVTDKWFANSVRPMGSASIVHAVEKQLGSVLSKEHISMEGSRKGVGHFPIKLVDIVLSEDSILFDLFAILGPWMMSVTC